MFSLFGRRKQEQLARLQRIQQQAENERREECEMVVDLFARYFGYIARECITRQELEQLIAYGITPKDLVENIKQRISNKDALVLGQQHFNGAEFPVKLTEFWRKRHVYAIGRSGSGKTNLLRTMILQDIHKGYGVGVLAPEQEMITEELLPYIPPDRFDDVIYVNPADTEKPIPLNPLCLFKGEDIDIKVDEMISVFSLLVGDMTPRMNEILYHTFYALIERRNSTLLDVEILLDKTTGENLRREIIHTSSNPRTVRFFEDIYPQLEKRDAFLPITSRIGRLISPKYVRNLLCQPGRSIDFRQAMDQGKILFFNLSDGLLGARTSQLLGQLIISKIQLAVMSRADTLQAERRPFYMYLDEFQTFTGVASESYERILSRARKYNFSITLAHQQTGQIPLELLREILGNVSTLICFNVSRSDVDRLSREFQMMDIEGNLSDLPPSELLSLRTGQAYVKIDTQSFFMTTRLFDLPPDRKRVPFIIEQSRSNYGNGGTSSPPPDDRQKPPRPTIPLPPRKPRDPSEVF